MKRIFIRSASLLTALTLVCSLTPVSLAQDAEPESVQPDIVSVDTLLVDPAPAVEEIVITQVGTYNEGRIRVTDGTLWGYAGSSGAVVIPIQFDAVEDFSLGCAQVTLDGKVGLLHYNGHFLLEPEYDELILVGYGVYLARQDEIWSLLSVNAFQSDGVMTHTLYSDLASFTLSTGVFPWLTLTGTDGITTRFPVNSLPQVLAERQVPGWQFSLSSKQTSFQDVSGKAWYDVWVDLACSMGMMQGIGNNTFAPLRSLTVAEALRLAACLESRALQDDFHLQSTSGVTWYSSSATYCEAVGLISPGQFSQADLKRPITRAEVADIFSATTPVRSIAHCNDLERIKATVPDVQSGDYAADAIYELYAKGILTGTSSALTFRPNNELNRAEAAAFIARIARPEHRITLW